MNPDTAVTTRATPNLIVPASSPTG
jgi:hypothetical protein